MGELYQNITISYYPACPQPKLTLGLQSFSDFGFITLLIQDNVGGLQVVKDVEWVTVDPVSHVVLVILGDQTELSRGESDETGTILIVVAMSNGRPKSGHQKNGKDEAVHIVFLRNCNMVPYF
ncbi:putative flavanone 3-dioxygenase [Helianthus debilis subsp. tardiflorus]